MSTHSFNSDDPAASTEKAALPAGQQNRAEHAHLDPNEPATQAEAGTPQYGNFGKANETEPAVPVSTKNDGSNDNPDEFSEFRHPNEAAVEDYGTDTGDANPEHQQGHVTQNKAPEEVKAAQHEDTDKQRAAWTADDARYAGGHQKASWEERNDDEHSND